MSTLIYINECAQNPDSDTAIAARRFLMAMKRDWQNDRIYRHVLSLPISQVRSLLQELTEADTPYVTGFLCRVLGW